MNKNSSESHFKRLGKDLFTYGVMGGIARGIQFILFPIFTRVFSVDEYGILDTVAVFSSLLGMGISLALPSALSRYFYDNQKELDNKILYSTLTFFTLLLALTLFIPISFFTDEIGTLLTDRPDVGFYVFLGALNACMRGIGGLSEMLLRLRKKIIAYNLLNITSTVLFVMLSLGAVFLLDMGLMGIFLSIVVSTFIPMLFGLGLNYRFLTRNIDFGYLKRALKYSVPMFPAVFVTWANKQLDRFILLTIIGLSEVGIYGAGFRISNIIELLTGIYRKAWGPFAMEIINEDGRDKIYKKALTLYSAVLTLLCLLFIAFSWEILWVIAPAEYHGSFYVIPWLLGAATIHGSLNMINLGTIISEKTLSNTFASWSGFIVNVVATILLVRKFGIQGAAVGTFIAELLTAVILWNRTKSLSEIEFETHKIVGILGIFISASVLTLLLGSADLMQIPNIVWRLSILITSGFAIFKISWDEELYRLYISLTRALKARLLK